MNKPRLTPALQAKWREKLQASGFEDIENPDGTLKEYHSFHFTSRSRAPQRAAKELYQAEIDRFTHHSEFKSLCRRIAKRSNRLDSRAVKEIWLMHCEGNSERQIATWLRMSKSGVHGVLEKFRKWMTLS